MRTGSLHALLPRRTRRRMLARFRGDYVDAVIAALALVAVVSMFGLGLF